MPTKDGSTLGAHQAAFRKMQGLPPIIRVPPHSGRTLWANFLDLHSARGSNGWGPNPISFTEIDAWSRTQGVTLCPWEVDVLRQLDLSYLKTWSAHARLR